MISIEILESNMRILQKTVQHLPEGRVKECVEMQIKQNLSEINDFFDQLADETKFIESYEQSNQ